MTRISILKRSIRTASAGLVFAGLLSPANATYRHEPISRRLGMKISLSLDIETPTAPKPPEPNGPVMTHDSRFIAQMMDRALPRISSHATIEAESAYPPQRTTWTGKRSIDKKI